jgi:uncharacterized protein involved in exopolysaccharide biosynthesis
MSENIETKNDFDSTNILVFLIKWWKHLAIISAAAAIAGVIFSSPFFITPLYESTSVMFPATSHSLSRAVFGGNVDFLQYGDVADAERLLQVLGSTAVRDRVVEHFDLYEHYEIPEDSKFRQTQLRKEYSSNISAKRTLFGAVEIKVRDKDPVMAADIANHMAALADTIQNEIRRERALLAYNVARQRYDNIVQEIASTEDSLRSLMKKGIYHYEAQSERLTQQLAIDISTNNQRSIRELENRIGILENHGGEFMTLRAHLNQVSNTLSGVQRIMQEARADLENFISFKYLLDDAFVAERKVYPTRWLIVFLSAFAAGLMGIIAIMTYENLEKKGVIRQKTK